MLAVVVNTQAAATIRAKAAAAGGPLPPSSRAAGTHSLSHGHAAKTGLSAAAAQPEAEGEEAAPSKAGASGSGVLSQPTQISAVLREYQLEGLAWMMSMYESGVNAILADEVWTVMAYGAPAPLCEALCIAALAVRCIFKNSWP